MSYYLKCGSKFVKRTKNRRLPDMTAILGTKAQAKVYKSETSAKKAKTTYEYQYRKELKLNGTEIKIKKAVGIKNASEE